MDSKSRQTVKMLGLRVYVLLILLSLAICARAQLASSAWPKFRGSIQNTGVGIGQTTTKSLRYAVSVGQNPKLETSPAIGPDGTLYVAGDDGHLYSMDSGTGNLGWFLAVGYPFLSSPTIGSDGTIYVGCNDGGLYALDPVDVSPKWIFHAGAPIWSSPAIALDGTIYFGSQDRRVYAIHKSNGSLKWSYFTGGGVSSSPAIAPDGKVVVGSSDGNVYAFDPSNGAVLWSYTANGEVDSSPAIDANGNVYVGSSDGNVYALNGKTGALIWSHPTGNAVTSSPAVSPGGTVYVGSNSGNLYALNSATGTLVWKFSSAFPFPSSPVIGGDGTVYIGGMDSFVYALDGGTGVVRWSYDTGGSIATSPAIGADGSLYVSAYDGKVYCFKGSLVTPSLKSVSLNPASVAGGVSSTGTVTLTGQAIVGGTVVSFSTNQDAASPPAYITIPAGQTTGTFTVSTSSVSTSVLATITASINGVSKTANLVVTPAALASVSLSPSVVTGGDSSTGSVTLTGPAPHGGVSIKLASSQTTVTLPSKVVITGGNTTVTFAIATKATSIQKVATIMATMGPVAKTATLTVAPPALTSLSLQPSSVKGGTSVVGTVSIASAAPSTGLVIKLSSSSKSALPPASVTIPSGKTSATFTTRTAKVKAQTAITITATSNGASKTATLTLS